MQLAHYCPVWKCNVDNCYTVIFFKSIIWTKKDESANIKTIMCKHMSSHILEENSPIFFPSVSVYTYIYNFYHTLRYINGYRITSNMTNMHFKKTEI